jgi:hypothetical protein
MGAVDPAFVKRRTMHLKLRDDTPIVVRPILPEDKWRLQDGMSRMSEASRFRRFMSSMERLTTSQLAYFTEIDYHDHFAYVALVDDESDLGITYERADTIMHHHVEGF